MLAVCVFPVAGCLHAPPAGATRGVVEIKNMRLRDDPEVFMSIGTLTGIAIGEHTVLTAAHTFLYDPEPGHPLKLNGQVVEYSIIADGWSGNRRHRDQGDKEVVDEEIVADYLFLHITEPVLDHANLVPLEFERIDDLRNLTLVSRRSGSEAIVAVSLKSWMIDSNKKFILISVPEKESSGLRLSGSPLIGTYSDGTLVLAGIVCAKGDVMITRNQDAESFGNQVFILPSYRIPFGLIAEP